MTTNNNNTPDEDDLDYIDLMMIMMILKMTMMTMMIILTAILIISADIQIIIRSRSILLLNLYYQKPSVSLKL